MQASKSKKQKLLQTIGFFAVLGTVLGILNYIFNPLRLGMVKYVEEHDAYYLSLMEEPENTIDVLVMGDSLSFGMINTIDFWEQGGITSYIAGQAGQVMPETYFELKKILKKQSPKVILLETGVLAHDFSTEMHIMVYQIMYHYIPATKYHELWKVMLGDTDKPEKVHFKGFEKRDVIAGYTGGPYMVETQNTNKVRGISKFYIKKFKKLCDENDVKLVLVSMPSPKNYNYEIHNGMEELASELGVTYIDFNLMVDELSLDWNTDMLDVDDHVNIYGTKKTSAWIMNYLKENYGIEKRTDKDIVDSWNYEVKELKDSLGIE